MKEAVRAHLLEAAWEDVLEESADESFGGKRGGPRGIGV